MPDITLESRGKRLKYDIDIPHTHIHSDTVPNLEKLVHRQCKTPDFFLTEKEKSKVDDLKLGHIVHSWLSNGRPQLK